MIIRQITDVIERFAPLEWQESYDNAGLIVGRSDDEVHKALLAVDVTEEVLDEAEAEGCDLVITHHPIVFRALKRFNSADPVERCVERAIRSRIALYACHTNLDSAPGGMSWRLAEMLGVGNLRVLQPSETGDGAGFGVVGELLEAVDTVEFMRIIQRRLEVSVVRYSDIATSGVRRVAVCTGAGASLIGEARCAGADIYITADMKYNDFMTPDKALTVIERFAPLEWQESYDNAGLIVGRSDDEVHKALLAVDVTEEVLDEAEAEGCDLVITHHPIVFRALKRFNSADPVERCVERAIRSRIALYACHTNLDSAPGGMSWRLAEMLGVGNLRVLQPSETGDGAGFGVVGELLEAVDTVEFMRIIQRRLEVSVVRYSDIATSGVRRVAVCTGAGASLIGEARCAGADIYITADMKYNDFMTPDKALTVADIGHFESEYCAIQLIFDILSKNLCTFAVRKSERSRNPVNYLV